MHLEIHDYVRSLSPGGVLPVTPSEDAILRTLARLVGPGLARRVLDAAGEAGALGMSAEEIARVARVPPNVARRIVAARELGERLLTARRPCASSSRDVIAALPRGIATLEFEVLLGIALDAQLHVKAVVLLAKGGAHSATLTARDVFVPLVRLDACAAVIVHNHPSGDPTPSSDDVAFTTHLVRAARMLGIEIVDHLIVARAGVTSFVDSGLMPAGVGVVA